MSHHCVSVLCQISRGLLSRRTAACLCWRSHDIYCTELQPCQILCLQEKYAKKVDDRIRNSSSHLFLPYWHLSGSLFVSVVFIRQSSVWWAPVFLVHVCAPVWPRTHQSFCRRAVTESEVLASLAPHSGEWLLVLPVAVAVHLGSGAPGQWDSSSVSHANVGVASSLMLRVFIHVMVCKKAPAVSTRHPVPSSQ